MTWYEEVLNVKGIKPSETIMESCWNDGIMRYIITNKIDTFYLYKVNYGIATKTKYKSNNPTDLKDYINGNHSE